MEEKKHLIQENKELVKGLLMKRKKLTIKLDQVTFLIQGYENSIKKLQEELEEKISEV